MKVISGTAIADHCDYDFGDQAGVVGQVLNAFMKDCLLYTSPSPRDDL